MIAETVTDLVVVIGGLDGERALHRLEVAAPVVHKWGRAGSGHDDRGRVTAGGPAESHLMRRSPRQGSGPGDVVVYTLEDLGAPAGEDPKAVIEVHRTGDTANVVGGGVPDTRRGHGYGPRLARQVTAAVRAEGCRIARMADPGTDGGRRMLVGLGSARLGDGMWEIVL